MGFITLIARQIQFKMSSENTVFLSPPSDCLWHHGGAHVPCAWAAAVYQRRHELCSILLFIEDLRNCRIGIG